MDKTHCGSCYFYRLSSVHSGKIFFNHCCHPKFNPGIETFKIHYALPRRAKVSKSIELSSLLISKCKLLAYKYKH